MMFAAQKLRGIGLVLLVFIAAMLLYPLSLQVAAKRSELARVNAGISQSRQSIRNIEAELAVRTNLRQLERWNSEYYRYTAPTASQFLSGERALAQLDRLPSRDIGPTTAPVELAMQQVAPTSGAAVDADAIVQPTQDAKTAPAATATAPVRVASADRPTGAGKKPTAQQDRLALLDEPLSDRVRAERGASANQEESR